MTVRHILLSVFFVAFFAPALASAQSKAPDELFKQGNDAFNEGQIDKAIELYAQATVKRKDFKEAWYNLGIAYGRKKQFDKEISSYEKAIGIDAKYTKALYNLAIAYEDKGSDDKAVEYYEKVVEAEPERGVDARINAGILYARKGQLDKAVEFYKAAIKIDPNVADAHFNLGIAYSKQAAKVDDDTEKKKLWSAEADAYKAATSKNPSYHKAWHNLAIAFKKLGNIDEEISAYLKAVGVKKNYPQALFNLAHAYEEKKDPVKALEYWGRYVRAAEAIPNEKKYVETAKQRIALLKKEDAISVPTTDEPAAK
ncbi:MAG: tetratricopeptide repeat protein [Myxococcota bacterium]|nr:tetratricopeptide repeat protein [Myxococcota bacterium]